MRNRLLVAGSCYMETVVWLDAIPSSDNSLSENNSSSRRAGGRGALAAVQAARIGAEVELCASIGKDDDGARLLDYFRANGISTSYVSYDRRQTGVSIHLHENSFSTDRKILCNGANYGLRADSVSTAMESLPGALFLTTEMNFDQVVETTHMARIQGVPVYLDAAGIKSTPYLGSLENIDLFMTDPAGVRSLTGVSITAPDRCLTAAMKLAKLVYARYYVIRLGTMGTFVYDGKLQHHIIPCSLEGKEAGAPVDTEAAVIASVYLLTGSIHNGCALGAVVAKMSRESLKNKIPTMKQAVEYCRENGIRLS